MQGLLSAQFLLEIFPYDVAQNAGATLENNSTEGNVPEADKELESVKTTPV